MKKIICATIALLLTAASVQAQEGQPVKSPPATAVETQRPAAPATPAGPSAPPIIPPSASPAANPTNPPTAKPETPGAGTPAQPAIKPAVAEPELDPESKRLLEEAKQKILKEKAEREATEKRAAEEAQRKKEAEKSFFGNLFANSELLTGVTGGLYLPLNNLHGTGFGGSVTVDYIAFKNYGLHLAAGTGQFSAKSYKLVSGNLTLNLPETGTFGFLAIDLAAAYVLPEFFGIRTSVGAGGSFYKLNGGNYSFGPVISPLILLSGHHKLFWNLDIGVVAKLVLPSTSKTTVSDSTYGTLTLDSSIGLSQASVQISVRYAWLKN
jgi:hypothetical protein